MEDKYFGLLLIAIGLFSIAGGAFNWNWYMNSRKARFMTTLLSRNGARIFYIALGCMVCIMGFFMAMNNPA